MISAATMTVGDPWPVFQGICSTGCQTCTCCNTVCPFREWSDRFVVVTAEREPSFDFPKLKPEPRRPFHQRINRKPWERG